MEPEVQRSRRRGEAAPRQVHRPAARDGPGRRRPMNARERILAVAVVGLVIVAGLGVVFYQFYLSPYRARQANLERLRKEGETKQARISEIAAQRAQLERYRQQSLPADLDVA